jgi:hypothetical protein
LALSVTASNCGRRVILFIRIRLSHILSLFRVFVCRQPFPEEGDGRQFFVWRGFQEGRTRWFPRLGEAVVARSAVLEGRRG